jgi:NAD(P)-dependent dehydrogenase (short-subunit alcohol dehydrogenase family)
MEYPDFTLHNQVGLVTGASKGIGYGVAKALAHAGARIAVAACATAALEQLSEEIRSAGVMRGPFRWTSVLSLRLILLLSRFIFILRWHAIC